MGEPVNLAVERGAAATTEPAGLDSARRVVVLSTHLDDGVLSLGATLAGLSEAGVPAEIVTVLAGDPDSRAPAGPWDLRTGFHTAGEAARARREEDRRACARLGVGARWLPYDGVQYGGPIDEDVVWRAVVDAVGGADVVLLPGWPLRHPDHLWMARLVLDRGIPGARIGLYTEQPDASRHPGDPGIATVLTPFIDHQDGTSQVGGAARWIWRKRRAWRAYRSQLPSLERDYGRRLHPVVRYESRRGGEAITWVRPWTAGGSLTPRYRNSWPSLAPAPGTGLRPGPSPTFSVIITTYQLADVVAEAVESALGQTRPPLEVIVCDDGSTDGTEAALAPYRDRIRYFRKENGGDSSAKNAAARVASGDFVALLDADDVYLPERLEALAALAAARPDLNILTTDAYVEVDGVPIRNYLSTAFVVEDQRVGILRDNFIFGAAAVRREHFLAVGGWDESLRISADWECWIRLILDGAQAGLVAEPLARYRFRPGSLSDGGIGQLRANVAILGKTAMRPDLGDRERGVLAAALATQRSRLQLAEAEASLRDHGSDARRKAMAIALDGRFDARSRVKAAVSGIAPRTAAAFLARRERSLGRSRLQRWMPTKG